MQIINIQAAKTHLSRIVERAVEGEEIVLAKAGKPLVKLVPFAPAQKPRTPGLLTGQGWEAPDCWTSDEKVFDPTVEGPLFHGAVEEPPLSPPSS
ncbi:MAG: type II toxin-antitoxin system Phd/YefM family antitoxin [Opitutaceae bacterium]